MIQVGIIGVRGMVGSTLLDRMRTENDLENLNITFFSTSQPNTPAPDINQQQKNFANAHQINSLAKMDILISTQGSQYTQEVHPQLRNLNWEGYWIDAASHLRMHKSSIIILDPINKTHIEEGLKNGIKDFIGSNCTVSLMLMAIAGLTQKELVKSIQATTYQAISGSGANAITELYEQLKITSQMANDQQGLDLANTLHHMLQANENQLPKKHIQNTLAMSLIPWIDTPMPYGQTKEEWKAMSETNKILNTGKSPIPIDSTCVRIPTLRCHSQSLFLELHQDLPIEEIETLIDNAHPWVKVVPNTQKESIHQLSPINCANSLTIKVGRIRKTNKSPNHIQLFTTGDQLLWGAAEPIRRTLKIIIKHIQNNQEHHTKSATEASQKTQLNIP